MSYSSVDSQVQTDNTNQNEQANVTSSENSSPRKNPYENKLVEQGFDFTIPDQYRHMEELAGGEKPLTTDPLTGLIVEDDTVRSQAVQVKKAEDKLQFSLIL